MRYGLRIWEPFGSIRPLDKWLEETANSLFPAEGEEVSKGTLSPKVDIYQTEKNYVVSADLPGMKKEDIKIDLQDNTLTLKAEKKFEEKVEKDKYMRVERRYGTFVRSFRLAENVDTQNIKATYKDGVLEVTLPKKEEAKPKQMKVEVQ